MHEGQNCSPKHQSLIATTNTIHISVQDKKKIKHVYIHISCKHIIYLKSVYVYSSLY